MGPLGAPRRPVERIRGDSSFLTDGSEKKNDFENSDWLKTPGRPVTPFRAIDDV